VGGLERHSVHHWMHGHAHRKLHGHPTKHHGIGHGVAPAHCLLELWRFLLHWLVLFRRCASHVFAFPNRILFKQKAISPCECYIREPISSRNPISGAADELECAAGHASSFPVVLGL
jgi:hypothetical protein